MSKKKPGADKNSSGELIYGIHPVSEALKAGRRRFSEILVAEGKSENRHRDIIELAESKRVKIKQIKAAALTTKTGTDSHQGIAAYVSSYPYVGLNEIMASPAGDKKPPFILILDSVVDPHNLGALSRTALCAGVDGLVIMKDRAASPGPAASKASAGALEHMKVARVTNIVNTIKELKDEGFWIVGLDANGDCSLYESDMASSLGLVVGGEDKGVRPLVRKNCDMIISIPQEGPVNSLNASVAGAVVMYEAYRQRQVK